MVPAFTCNDDRRQAAKLLHTNAGFFTSIFVCLALFGIVAVFAAMALFGFSGPVSGHSENAARFLRRELREFCLALASYLALFAIGYLLHRFIRSKLDSRKGRLSSRRMTRP
jgi:hypothetical protein